MIILGGDHVYKMDYSEMLAAHINSRADLTVACTEVPKVEAKRFGVMGVDTDWRVQRFQEKPDTPDSLPDKPECALASMGIYIFNTETLVRELLTNSKQNESHDFGKDIIPRMVRSGERVCAFPFRDRNSGAIKYWRDIGTIDSYYEAHMDLIAVSPVFNLYDQDWPIRTYQVKRRRRKPSFVGQSVKVKCWTR